MRTLNCVYLPPSVHNDITLRNTMLYILNITSLLHVLVICLLQWFSLQCGVPKGQRHEPGGQRRDDAVSGGCSQDHQLLIHGLTSDSD